MHTARSSSTNGDASLQRRSKGQPCAGVYPLKHHETRVSRRATLPRAVHSFACDTTPRPCFLTPVLFRSLSPSLPLSVYLSIYFCLSLSSSRYLRLSPRLLHTHLVCFSLTWLKPAVDSLTRYLQSQRGRSSRSHSFIHCEGIRRSLLLLLL